MKGPVKKGRRAKHKNKQSTKRLIRKRKKAFKEKSRKHAKQLLSLGINPSRNMKRKNQKMAVPNLCPFKQDLIERALRKRQDLKKELALAKLTKKNRKVDLRKAIDFCKEEREKGMMVPKSLASTSFPDGEGEMRLPKNTWEHKHWYFKELNQVINRSDVIIEVLDARDPDGCRSREIERRVIRQQSSTFMGRKRLILLINKIDLVPAEILAKWMKVLKREYPVVAFKASTQSQRRKLHSNVKFNKVTSDKGRATTNRCVGAQMVIDLLKKYSLSHDKTTPITVGFIGYPNTGKSSVINSLKRSQSMGTSSTAGFTTHVQTVRLDSKIQLVDSPGVILNDNEVETRLVLRNALKLQKVDPVEAVAHILTVANHRSLAKIYGLRMPRGMYSWESYEDFLMALSSKLNRMTVGGVADLDTTAKLMIMDWNSGKIPFYVNPPDIDEDDAEIRVVPDFAEKFDIEKFMKRNHKQAVKEMRQMERRASSKRSYMEVDMEKFMIGREVVDETTELAEVFEDMEVEDEPAEEEKVNLLDDEVMQTDAFLTAYDS